MENYSNVDSSLSSHYPESIETWKLRAKVYRTQLDNMIKQNKKRKATKTEGNAAAKISKLETNRRYDPFEFLNEDCCDELMKFLNAEDFLVMTEVCRKWKNKFQERNEIKNLKLNVNLKKVPKSNLVPELINSVRQYKKINLQYNSESRSSCVALLKRFSDTANELSIEKTEEEEMEKSIVFDNIQKLKLIKPGNRCLRWLFTCHFTNIVDLEIDAHNPPPELKVFIYQLYTLKNLSIKTAFDSERHWHIDEDDDDDDDTDYSQDNPEFSLKTLHLQVCEYPDTFVSTQQELVSLSAKNIGAFSFQNILSDLPLLKILKIACQLRLGSIEAMAEVVLPENQEIIELVATKTPMFFMEKLLLVLPALENLEFSEFSLSKHFIGFLSQNMKNLKTVRYLLADEDALEYYETIKDRENINKNIIFTHM